MKRIVTCIPLTWMYIPVKFFESILSMKHYSIGKYELEISIFGSCYQEKSRDALARRATQGKPDYIYFLDADQMYPDNSPEILMKHIDDGKLVVGGITPDKAGGNLPMVYNIIHDEGIVIRDKCTQPFTGLKKVDAMGFGGIMVDPKVFDIIEFPWFQSGWNEKIFSHVSEDIRFYVNCKHADIDVWCDTDLAYGHIHTAPIEFQEENYGIPWGHWAIAEKDWNFIRGVIQEKEIKTVLEFGSGLSTLLISEIAEVDTFETEVEWVRRIEAKVPSNRKVKFHIWNEQEPIKWNGKKYDLAFVDGPRGKASGGVGREISMKIAAKCADKIIVHDAGRADEAELQKKFLSNRFNFISQSDEHWTRCHYWERK